MAVVVVMLVATGLGIYAYSYTKPKTVSLPSQLSQVFGTDFYSENVSIAQVPVGSSVSFQGVTFTRVAYGGLPNEPNGFNFTLTFSSNGRIVAGSAASQDGRYVYASTNTVLVNGNSTSMKSVQTAGYVVYPSKGVIELLVKA